MSVTQSPSQVEQLRKIIREVPDFPRPGILFYDITTLLSDPTGLRIVTSHLVERYRDMKVDKVVGIETRGLIFAAPVAMELGVGLIPARKPGKLPYQTVTENYELEYGSNTIQMHADAIAPGERVLIVDDLIATGGTLLAAARLIRRMGAELFEAAAIIDLPELGGSQKLQDMHIPTFTLTAFALDDR